MIFSKIYLRYNLTEVFVDALFRLPSTSQIEFSFCSNERMMNNKQAVLNIVPSSCTLLVIVKFDHFLGISDKMFYIASHIPWHNSSFDVKFKASIDSDIPSFIVTIGILFDIVIFVEKIFVAFCAFPKIPSSTKIVFFRPISQNGC